MLFGLEFSSIWGLEILETSLFLELDSSLRVIFLLPSLKSLSGGSNLFFVYGEYSNVYFGVFLGYFVARLGICFGHFWESITAF